MYRVGCMRVSNNNISPFLIHRLHGKPCGMSWHYDLYIYIYIYIYRERERGRCTANTDNMVQCSKR